MKEKLLHYKNNIHPFPFTKSLQSSDAFTSKFFNQRSARVTTLTQTSSASIMLAKPQVGDLNKSAFLLTSQNKPNNFLSALSCLVNSDVVFQTNSLRRLMYPHMNNFPCTSPENIYFVKLFVNGIRRCIPLDGAFDPAMYYTKNNELYPLLIEKALKNVYYNKDVYNVLPNFLLYRMIGWIPEVLYFGDIGDCQQSYEKLKESFLSFSVMLSFDYKGFVLPILEFVNDENNTGQMLIKTILFDQDTDDEYINSKFFQQPKSIILF